MNTRPTEAAGTKEQKVPAASVGRPPGTVTAPGAAFIRAGVRRRGLSLVELLIVVVMLAVLAAVAIPITEWATRESREASLKETLRVVREAIERYRVEHFGQVPGYPGGEVTASPTEAALVSQLTGCTLPFGQPAAGGVEEVEVDAGVGEVTVPSEKGTTERILGPYLPEIPENAINGKTSIRVVAGNEGEEAMSPSDADGWVYRASDGRFGCDAAGETREGVAYGDL